MAECKRLYVGGLFPGVNEDQLKQRFSKFGEITGVEIKSKQLNEADQPNTFAFIDIDITPNNLVKCFSVFSNCRWKGCEIKLQVAKESFLERLKKEKEGNIKVAKTNNPNFEPVKTDKWVKPAESLEKEVKPSVKPEVPVRSLKINHQSQPPESVDVVEQTFDVVERLEKFSGSVWRDQDERKDNKRTDRSLLSNEKRLKSIGEKLEEAKVKEKLISNALKMTVDGKPRNNRITFDCDEEENGAEVKMKKSTKLELKKQKKKLFDGDEEEMEEEDPQKSFQLKPQFEGESGQKLLELQTRFGNDDRFRLDHRFQENDEDISQEVNDDDEMESQLEKSRNLEILGSIVGGPVRSGKRKSDGTSFMARRYDPTKADCASLEVHREKIQKPVAKDESEQITEENDKVEEVDTTRFYQVDSNLADLFSKGKKQDSTFSILNTFGSKSATISKDNPKTNESDGALRTYWQHNPFSHDSSSDEEEIAVEEHDEPSAVQPVKPKFFFTAGDSRFKEGLAFYKKIDSSSSNDQWVNRKLKAKQLFKSRRKQIRRKVNSQKLLVKKKKKRLVNHSKSKSKRKKM